MTATIRVATFNLENLDDKPGQQPSLAERIAVMRPQLERLGADILCLQEVNGQEQTGEPRRLLALEELFAGTAYENYSMISTRKADGSEVYDERNLVIVSRFEILAHRQLMHDYAQPPRYQKVTAVPPEEVKDVKWERPIFYAKIRLDGENVLHVLNLHLKSRLPSNVNGQKIDTYTWRSAAGWAEGSFLSAMKRVGQALEARIFVDTLFNEDEQAKIIVCGDLNAQIDEVPAAAIRGEVENTGNPGLSSRVLVPCELSIPESCRYTLLHRGRGSMLDHMLVSRCLLPHYRGAEIHNEILHDESLSFATDKKYPESDHAPLVACFAFP